MHRNMPGSHRRPKNRGWDQPLTAARSKKTTTLRLHYDHPEQLSGVGFSSWTDWEDAKGELSGYYWLKHCFAHKDYCPTLLKPTLSANYL